MEYVQRRGSELTAGGGYLRGKASGARRSGGPEASRRTVRRRNNSRSRSSGRYLPRRQPPRCRQRQECQRHRHLGQHRCRMLWLHREPPCCRHRLRIRSAEEMRQRHGSPLATTPNQMAMRATAALAREEQRCRSVQQLIKACGPTPAMQAWAAGSAARGPIVLPPDPSATVTTWQALGRVPRRPSRHPASRPSTTRASRLRWKDSGCRRWPWTSVGRCS